MIGVGIAGYGYWGPNLARNFTNQPDCSLVAIYDINPTRIAVAKKHYPHAEITADYSRLLANDSVRAILISTPVSTHYALAKQALLAGKDVLIEKPMTQTVPEAAELIRIAKENKCILAIDHTFIFTGAVQKIKQIVDSGELGSILYVDSVRVNLGLFQKDINVISDLAPHDLSIVSHVFGKKPVMVQAMGGCHTQNGLESMAYLHVEYDYNLIAHFHLSWVSPVKIRRTMIAGDRKMLVYDDLESSEKVKVYDRSVSIRSDDSEMIYNTIIDYRIGDMVAPWINQREALDAEAEHFLSCVRNRARPMIDGSAGMEVVRIIEAAKTSLKNNGSRVAVEYGE